MSMKFCKDIIPSPATCIVESFSSSLPVESFSSSLPVMVGCN